MTNQAQITEMARSAGITEKALSDWLSTNRLSASKVLMKIATNPVPDLDRWEVLELAVVGEQYASNPCWAALVSSKAQPDNCKSAETMTRAEAHAMGVAYATGEKIEMESALPKVLSNMFRATSDARDDEGMDRAHLLCLAFSEGLDRQRAIQAA
jgi:hypothetical protein